MLDKNGRPLLAMAKDQEIFIRPEMINRHGLITGATGTGKTVSLQSLAETFSALGAAVFMADVKGDLAGVSQPGALAGKQGERVKELNLVAKGYKNRGFPVCFWDVGGKKGHPLRATITDVGPLLLARLLGLTDAQAGVLQIVFRIADDNGLLLLDLKDLRSMIQYASDNREEFRGEYGLIAPASAAAIQRALLRLEEEGGDEFFGEPALDVMDLIKSENGYGVINILDATRLANAPGLYACVLLWLLSELFERLPETGDLPAPKLVFFFDEAHLLFDGISPALLQKLEQVARLIRSRGVGVFFVSQNPSDIPDAILGQLGNRVQHALRAFTPKDQKAVRAAAQAFRPNPDFDTQEAISSLGVGEALVSFLDEKGAPEVVQRSLMIPPEGAIGPIADGIRAKLLASSPMAGKYDQAVDRESAYEILAARAQWLNGAKELASQTKAQAKAAREAEKLARRQEAAQKREAKSLAKEQDDPLGGLLGSVMRQAARSASGAAAKEIGKAVFGAGAGGRIGASIVRGILGGLLGGRK